MATQKIAVNDSGWTLLGSGALVAETKSMNDAYLHIAASAPAANEGAYHDLFGPASFSYSGSENVYARAASGSSEVIVTGMS
jgi:hypothetical protein